MKIKLIIMLIFILSSISWSQNLNDKTKIKKKSDKINITSNEEDKITKLSINLKKIKNKKKYLSNWFLKNYLKNQEDFKIKELYIKKHSVLIYKISLSNYSPTSLNKQYSIIYFQKSNLCFIIPIIYNKIIFYDNNLMIGGFKESREFQYYSVYLLKNSELSKVMDSSEDCDYGIKVGYFRNDECYEYSPNQFEVETFNENEIRFNGVIKKYCKLNTDRDENVKVPLEIIDSQIIYKYSIKESKWIFQKKSIYSCW